MAKIYYSTILLHRGEAAAWKKNNPVLECGEPGFEIDTGKLKIGDGERAWNDLEYFDGDFADHLKNTSAHVTAAEKIKIANAATKTDLNSLKLEAIALVSEYVEQFEESIDEMDDRLDPLEAQVWMTSHFHTIAYVKETSNNALYAKIVANNLATGEMTETLAYNPKRLSLSAGDKVNVFIACPPEGYNYTIESLSETNFSFNPYVTMFKSREDLADEYGEETLSIKYPVGATPEGYVNVVYVLEPKQWQNRPYLKFKLGEGTTGRASIHVSMNNDPATSESILIETSSMDDVATFNLLPLASQYPDAKLYLSVVAIGGDTIYDQFYLTDENVVSDLGATTDDLKNSIAKIELRLVNIDTMLDTINGEVI